MLGFKNAFFYLVALQINILKFFKKIYFSTNHYNKSLISIITPQVSFNPNPYLLAIISPYAERSFKISEINPNNFWLEKNKKKLEQNHNFLWLNLINRKTDGKNIQKIIDLWILKYSNYKEKIWENSVLSLRVISWVLNIDIIINNKTFEFKRNFFRIIISQCNHIKRNLKFEKDSIKRVEMFTALLLSGLVFKDYEENFNVAIHEIEKFVKSYFDKDGFPLSRNPNELIIISKHLILCGETIKDAQKYAPEFLDNIIEKNLNCINFIKTPENKIPLFNGATEGDLNQFEKYILENKKKEKEKKEIIGGIYSAKFKSQALFVDVGQPPSKNFSSNYQSGPMSFEYFLDGIKIITNCGYGRNISPKAELISKFTASQSTLTINDTSVTKFERNKLLNKVFGNSINSTFKTSNFNSKNDKSLIGCSVVHNGYEKDFSTIYEREIYLDKTNNKVTGIDKILKKSDGIPIRYAFRFFLHPSLSVVKTMSGNSALIQLSKSKSLIFTIDNEELEIEKSIFMGGKKVLDNYCITVAGNLVNKNKTFTWEIKKKI